MQVLTPEEREQFKAAVDRCLELVESGASEEDIFEHPDVEAFIEVVAGLLEKYDELTGIRYRNKTFVPDYSQDEDGDFITGVRWFEDDKFEVVE